MDFIPGNDVSEWQVLGDEDRYVLYQQVTVQEPMGWSGLSLDCYRAACGKYSGRVLAEGRNLINVGYIALKWNTEETLPMNCDISLTTDILIYDSCGKRVLHNGCVFCVGGPDSGKGLAIHARGGDGVDVQPEAVHSVRRWSVHHLLCVGRAALEQQAVRGVADGHGVPRLPVRGRLPGLHKEQPRVVSRDSSDRKAFRRLQPRPACEDLLPGPASGGGEPRGVLLRVRRALQRLALGGGAGVLHGPIAFLPHARLRQRAQPGGSAPRGLRRRGACRDRWRRWRRLRAATSWRCFRTRAGWTCSTGTSRSTWARGGAAR